MTSKPHADSNTPPRRASNPPEPEARVVIFAQGFTIICTATQFAHRASVGEFVKTPTAPAKGAGA